MTYSKPWPPSSPPATAACPCCKRKVDLYHELGNKEWKYIGHGGGLCTCTTFLCRYSHEHPELKP